jgi:hypothetical protein
VIDAIRDRAAEVEYPDVIPPSERTCSMFSSRRIWIGDLTQNQAVHWLPLCPRAARPAFPESSMPVFFQTAIPSPR